MFILSNRKNGTLYVGASDDLLLTVRGYREERIWGFARKYHLKKLVHFETFETFDQAEKRKLLLRRFKRQDKVALIEAQNPDWLDLYDGLAKVI